MFRKAFLWSVLAGLVVTASASVDLTAKEGEKGPPEGKGEPSMRIVPYRARVLVGMTRRFRTVGIPQAVTWAVLDSSDEGVGSIDTTGLFTALKGGWVILGVKDPETDSTLASTDTVWVMGGPTKVHRRNGRVFAAGDTFVVVHFPPQARERAMIVLLEKRGKKDLPEKARGKGVAVAVFEFEVQDAETGQEVKKFEAKVRLTLHYRDEDIPEGVEEEDLIPATFDEEDEEWKEVPEEDVVDVDRDANTITVETDHASFWAVMDRTSLTASVQNRSWGRIKVELGR